MRRDTESAPRPTYERPCAGFAFAFLALAFLAAFLLVFCSFRMQSTLKARRAHKNGTRGSVLGLVARPRKRRTPLGTCVPRT